MKESRYIFADVKANNNKFWNIKIEPNFTVVTSWGRVGDNAQSKEFPHGSLADAEKFFDRKCREKERKGYVKQRVLIGEYTTQDNTSLASVAKQQINTNSPELDELIAFLTKANVHNILTATAMEYDTSKGVFTTPLGVVTNDAIQDARSILASMGLLVHNQDWNSPDWNSLLSMYLTAIPQKIGRRKPDPRELFPSLQAIQNQSKILDDLEASFQSVVSAPLTQKGDDTNTPQVFDVKLHLVDDQSIIRRIKNKYDSTRKTMHASYHLGVKRVFSVEINAMAKAYGDRGKNVGNVMELWHGTRAGNLLSILKGGLQVPPASSPHVTGRMFGDGLYFSDQSTKSLNYAYGAAPGQRGGIESSTFMFLADVAMGRPFVPTSYTRPSKYPVQGHDSIFAKAGQSGVHNNEMIVYTTDQCNLTYLVEFGN